MRRFVYNVAPNKGDIVLILLPSTQSFHLISQKYTADVFQEGILIVLLRTLLPIQ